MCENQEESKKNLLRFVSTLEKLAAIEEGSNRINYVLKQQWSVKQ